MRTQGGCPRLRSAMRGSCEQGLAAVIPGWSAGPDPESRDSGFDAEPVIGPRFARTRWHRPGMTASYFLTHVRNPAAQCARVVHEISAPERAWGMPGARCTLRGRSLILLGF